MGTWGAGNFDSDAAGEIEDKLHRYLVGAIVYGLASDLSEELNPDGSPYEPAQVVLAVDMLALLETHTGYVARVSLETVKKWRAKYFAILEADTSGTGSGVPNYKERRRKVAEECFDRLEKAIWDNES